MIVENQLLHPLVELSVKQCIRPNIIAPESRTGYYIHRSDRTTIRHIIYKISQRILITPG